MSEVVLPYRGSTQYLDGNLLDEDLGTDSASKARQRRRP